MAVSRRLRFEILRRDDHTCRYCGATAPDVKLTIDHVVPNALGGSDDPTNLVTACEACNGGKTSTTPDGPLVADVADDALRWAGAIRVAADQMLADLDRRNALRATFNDAWMKWGVGEGDRRTEVPRPGGWAQSIDSFMAAGLPMPVLLDCLDMAMRAKKVKPVDTFRYMCGIAWKKVTELQNAAREHLTEDEDAGDLDEDFTDYEVAYRELVGHVFGKLDGVSSDSDVEVMARASMDDMDHDEYCGSMLTDEGHAAAAILTRTSEALAEFSLAFKVVFLLLPDERFDELYGIAARELNWSIEMQQVDDRRLFNRLVSAQMLHLHLAQTAETFGAEQEGSK
jgi:hypothetical protein